jgi:uroporphyrinogen decarboxylase
MLGFAGSPWTVATYMVAGEGSRDQHETRSDGLSRSGSVSGDHRRDHGRVTIEYLSPARSPPAPRRCNCSTAGRAVWPRRIRTLGDRAQRRDCQRDGRVFPTCRSSAFRRVRAKSSRPMPVKPGLTRWARRDDRPGLGGMPTFPPGCRCRAILIRCCCLLAAKNWNGRRYARTRSFRRSSACVQSGARDRPDTPLEHVEQLLSLVRGWRRIG